jgi:hypothetical protein
MSLSQRIIISLGLLVVTGFCLRPPFQWERTTYLINPESNVPHRAGTTTTNAGHHWIWSPPDGTQNEVNDRRTSRSAVMDWQRLSIYVGLTAAIVYFGAFMILGSRKERLK